MSEQGFVKEEPDLCHSQEEASTGQGAELVLLLGTTDHPDAYLTPYLD